MYAGVQALKDAHGKPFWECEPSLWDACNNVGLRSHYLASMYAARIMAQHQRGLICNISSWGGLFYVFGAAYGAGKAGCDRLSSDMAVELKPYNITSVSIWPGIVATELFSRFALERDEQNDGEAKSSFISDQFNWETPLLTGRVIAKLASESNLIRHTGKVQIVAELARKYGIVDQDGNLPASLRSLRFLLPLALPSLKKYYQFIPDLKVPWSLLLLTGLKSPRI